MYPNLTPAMPKRNNATQLELTDPTTNNVPVAYSIYE